MLPGNPVDTRITVLKKFNTLIIGGGPAGLFTAVHCSVKPVLLLEKRSTPGNKLLISGSGHCNLTHSGELSAFLDHYGDHSKFLKTALYGLSNTQLIRFFENRGLSFVEDKNGKIFPQSGRAADVLNVMLLECETQQVSVFTGQQVTEVQKKDDGFFVSTEKETFQGRNLVLATGGMSYQATGSSGDGYRFAKEFGHSIVPPKPALSPVIVKEYSMAELAGISLQEKRIYLYRGNRKIATHRGDIGFTHKGLSGPGILDFSRFIQSEDLLKIDLLGLQADEFRRILIEASEKSGKTAVQTFLKKYDLPKNLVKIVLSGISVEPDQTLATLEKEKRNLLVSAFCELPFVIERVGGFNQAMVTKGGVSLDEVSPKTMESRLVQGLYFAGELLDIDGDTGGYNLQAAFSTAYLAAASINRQDVKMEGI